MLIMNHLVHLQTKGKIGFRSKHPLEPAHALNLLTYLTGKCSQVVRREGGYYVLRGSLVGWRHLGAGGRLRLSSLISPVLPRRA